jgi:hypothetical protein
VFGVFPIELENQLVEGWLASSLGSGMVRASFRTVGWPMYETAQFNITIQ